MKAGKWERFFRLGCHCAYCGKRLAESEVVWDHLIPRCKRGGNGPENLLPACWFCNSSKGSKTLEEFRKHCYMRDTGTPKFTDNQISWMKRTFNVDIEKHVRELFQGRLFYFEAVQMPVRGVGGMKVLHQAIY
jgi:hypothetical protein